MRNNQFDTAAPKPNTGGSPSLLDIIATIWRRKWVVLFCAFLGAGIAFLLTMNVAPKYVSRATLLVDLRQLEVTSNTVLPNAPASLLETLVNSERSRLTSHNLLRQVVEKHDLYLEPEFGGASTTGLLIGALKASLGFGKSSSSDKQAAAAAKLRKKLTVERKKDTLVLSVSIASEDPARARLLTQSLLDIYLQNRGKDAEAAAQKVLSALQGQLTDQVKRLTEAENAVERYKVENAIIPSNGQLSTERQITTVTDQLDAARLEVAQLQSSQKQAKQAMATLTLPQTTSGIDASGVVADLRSRLITTQEEYASLQSVYGPQHPRMQAMKVRITSLTNALRNELSKSVQAIDQSLKRARGVVASLERQLQKIEGDVGKTNQKLVPLRELERRVEAARTVYVQTLTRIREIKAQQGVDASNVRILSDPTMPLDNEAVSRKLLLLLGSMFGASFGALFGFFTAPKASTKLNGKSISDLTGLPILAELPAVDAQSISRGLGASGIVLPKFSRRRAPVAAYESAMDQLYLRLCEPLAQLGAKADGPAIVLATSPGKQDTSPYSANLAALAVEDGKRVLLLVDDGESRPLASYLDGLQRVLMANADHAPQSGGQVDYCLVGPRSLGGIRQLKQHFEQLLRNAANYDLILIDGQSLANSVAFDFYTEISDRILLVIKEDKVDAKSGEAGLPRQLEEAYQRLGGARDKVSGFLYLVVDEAAEQTLYSETLTAHDLPLRAMPAGVQVQQVNPTQPAQVIPEEPTQAPVSTVAQPDAPTAPAPKTKMKPPVPAAQQMVVEEAGSPKLKMVGNKLVMRRKSG